MTRKKRDFKPDHSYHITTRCNNRDFRLTQFECKQVLLFCLKKCQDKYDFVLYALCIMSNHVHYLIEPKHPNDIPRIMHWLNWYTAMCFNRMLNRTGHFWEKRYYSGGFPNTDKRRALNTIRYIHANPKDAEMQPGWFYDFSNYGSYARLTDDGLTQWHPAFLLLGKTLEMCAAVYRKFCNQHRPKPKSAKKSHWGSKLLAGFKPIRKSRKQSPGQMSLWDDWQLPFTEIEQVAKKFVLANCRNPDIASANFTDSS